MALVPDFLLSQFNCLYREPTALCNKSPRLGKPEGQLVEGCNGARLKADPAIGHFHVGKGQGTSGSPEIRM